MKYVVYSAAEAEMTALFLTAKEMVPLRHTKVSRLALSRLVGSRLKQVDFQ